MFQHQSPASSILASITHLAKADSSMNFMENQVLGYKSPLYGRKTSQMKIQPFDFFESRALCSNFSPEQQAVLYGALWGVPEYYMHVNPQKDLNANLTDLFFRPGGRLFEEPQNLLKQEMRAPATYNAVITAIAQGASRLNEIATKAGLLGEGERHFIFFSKSGFTKKFIKAASEKPNVQLITFEEMTKP